jgi:hypothetical protein
MPFSLLQAVAEHEAAKPVAEILVAAAIAISTWMQKRGDSKTREELTSAIAAHSARHEERFDAIDTSVTELKGICIGADGKNGIRGAVAELTGDVRKLQTTCSETSVTVGRMDERVKGVERRVGGIEQRERDK